MALGVILALLILAGFRELLYLCLFLFGIAIFFLLLIGQAVATLSIVATASIIGVSYVAIKRAKKENLEDMEDIRQGIDKSLTGLTWIENNEVTNKKTILRITTVVVFLLPFCFWRDGTAAVPLFLVFLITFWCFIYDRFRKYKRECERSKIKTMIFLKKYTEAGTEEWSSRWPYRPL